MAAKAVSLRHKIPIVRVDPSTMSYGKVPVNSKDPRYGEPLVRLESFSVAYESYYARTDGANPPFHCSVEGSRKDMWARKSIVEKLARVNERLRPYGAEVFVWDGYRSIECQKGLWAFFRAKAKQENPDAGEEDCTAYALKFMKDPSNFDERDSTTWLPHTTGAALDLTLRDRNSGQLFDMGSMFEENIDASIADYFERQLAQGLIDEYDVRLQNRRLLHWSMNSEGFVNDSTNVYWHYDWGNQLYVTACQAMLGKAPEAAWYGYVKSPA